LSPTIVFTELLDDDQLRRKHIGRELIQYGGDLPVLIRWLLFTHTRARARTHTRHRLCPNKMPSIICFAQYFLLNTNLMWFWLCIVVLASTFQESLTLFLQTADVSLEFVLGIHILNGKVVGNHLH